MLCKLAGKLINFVVPLAKNVLAPSDTMATASAVDCAIQRKMCGGGFIRAGKRIILIISNEDMDDFIRTIKSGTHWLSLFIDRKQA